MITVSTYSATNIQTDAKDNTIIVETTNYWFANSLMNNPNILQYNKHSGTNGELTYQFTFTNDASVKAFINQKAQIFDKQASK